MWPTRYYKVILQSISSQDNAKVANVYNFLKRTLTKFSDSSDLEWDELLPFAFCCY